MAPIQQQSSSSKKRKKNKQSSESNKKKTKPQKLSDVKHLGEQLLSSKAYINNLPLLLNYLNPTPTASYPREFVLESLLSLQSFFTPLLPHLPSSNAKPTEDPESIYRTWVRSKFDEFVTCLVGLSVSSMFHDEDEALREVVLDTLMECVKVGNVGKFHSHIYYKFIKNMIFSIKEADTLLNLLVSKYFKYIDIRYFTYISIEKLIGKDVKESSDSEKESTTRASGQLLIRNIHHVLSKIPPLEQLGENSEYEMWNASGVFTKEGETESKKVKGKEAKKSGNDLLIRNIHHVLSKIPPLEQLGENSEYEMWNASGVFTKEGETESKKVKGKEAKKSGNDVPSPAKISKKMKMKFSKAWMSFLALPLPIDVYKEVLVTLHQTVIPYLSSPIMLCDFLTRSYDIGGVISVMALSSLFILMTEHGLEYPNLYVKLYALLEPSVFIAKHRAKFFELLDSCLKSPLLPAYLAASFAKKLSRLALTVPPSGGLVIVALIHNLLRRHPSINCLVHKEDNVETAKDVSSIKSGIDQFKNDETDLLKTNAMRSSLWEIDTLRHHYCPPVSRFVLSLENDLTVRSKTTEVAVKDFSSGSYATIFREEIRRRVKQVPLAFYKAIPTSLFSESDFSGWTFQSDNNNKSSEEIDSRNSAERQSE